MCAVLVGVAVVVASFNTEGFARGFRASSSLGRSIDKVRKTLEDVQATTEKVGRVKKFTNKLIGTKKAYPPPISTAVKPYRGNKTPPITSEKSKELE